MQFLQLELLKAQERRRSAAVPSPAINTTQGGRGQGETRPGLSTTTGGRGQGAVQTRAGGRGQEAAQTDPSNVANRRQKSGVEAQNQTKQEVKTGECLLSYLRANCPDLQRSNKDKFVCYKFWKLPFTYVNIDIRYRYHIFPLQVLVFFSFCLLRRVGKLWLPTPGMYPLNKLPIPSYQPFAMESGIFAVWRIRDVYPGSRIRLFSIPDPGSELSPSRIPDPHQRI